MTRRDPMTNVTRRTFLRTGAALAACAGLAPELLARPRGQVMAGKTLVLVFLRGGADGLNLVVPHASEAYYRMRGWLAVPRPGREHGALDLDGAFGLNPAAEKLLPFFENGSGVAVHAVGHARNSRSHFEEQDVWETCVVDDTVNADGWLNRHLQTTEGRGPIRAVGLGETLPRVLRGDASAIALRGLNELSLGGGGDEAMLHALERASQGDESSAAAGAALARSGRETLAAVRTLRRALASTPAAGGQYPRTDFGRRLRDAATLVRMGIGVEVIELDLGGWDTHRGQGAQAGPYASLVADLSASLAAFLGDVEDRMDDVLVLVHSEFGRTAAINGTGGTDHGWGNVALAFGGPVAAAGRGPRKLLGRWPGLEGDQLWQGRDLRHTTDFRDLFGEALERHLGNTRTDEVLPGHERQRVGVI